MMRSIQGKGVSAGMAQGTIHDIRTHTPEHTQPPEKGTPDVEQNRFRTACQSLHDELRALIAKARATVGEAEAEIFTTHRLMLEDEDFTHPIEQSIAAGCSAHDAVRTTGDRLAKQFSAMDDPYLQAREADIRSITDRLCRLLTHAADTHIPMPSGVIIVAKELSPTETLSLDTQKVLGIVTEQGAANSHAAILARTLGIPAITATGPLPPHIQGTSCILHGETGTLYLSPTEAIRQQYDAYIAAAAKTKAEHTAMRGHTCHCADGHPIRICANGGSLADVQTAAGEDAEGIGLFRSEFLFMRTDRCPTEDEQYALYKDLLAAMPDKEVVIRTLDAGADKKIPWLADRLPLWQTEENPALGLRAVRISLCCPDLLTTQLRALYRAAIHGKLSTMIPMLTLPSELEKVQNIAAKVRESLQTEGIPHDPTMPIGIMIETPSAALCAEELAKMAAFFSIGTNDLIQYTMAADRENPSVAHLTETVSDSVKKLLHITATAAHKAGIPVSICGELAGETSMIPFWVQEGIDKLSVSPGQVLSVRAKVQAYLDSSHL